MYRVLVVDDSEENLSILKMALNQEYKVSIAKDGAAALQLISTLNPDIILLDVNMPGIDGYETLRRIKRMPKFMETPVIFVSGATEITDKRKGFELGAVDYIAKPYEITEVKLRVKTHVELSKAREEKQYLLSNTLAGTIQAFMELLSINNPFAYEYSNNTKKLAAAVARDMGVSEVWKVEIAAMLSLIGTCVTPPEKTEMIITGKNLPLEDMRQFASHPSIGSRLVAKIPRLEELAEIIKNQMEPLGEMDFDSKNTILAGSQILAVVINYQNYIHRGQNPKGAITLLKQNRAKNNIDVIKALDRVLAFGGAEKLRSLGISDLKEEMILAEDILAADGSVLVKRGTAVNELVIEYLRLLQETGKMSGSVRVRTDA